MQLQSLDCEDLHVKEGMATLSILLIFPSQNLKLYCLIHVHLGVLCFLIYLLVCDISVVLKATITDINIATLTLLSIYMIYLFLFIYF